MEAFFNYLSWIWNGIRILGRLAKFAVRPGKWGQWIREQKDWINLRAGHKERRAVVHSLGKVIASTEYRSLSGSAKARKLSQTVLIRAQEVVRMFCPDAICCLKVAESEEFLRCHYPPECLPRDAELLEKVEIGRSYAGLSLRNQQPYFVDDLSDANTIAHPEEVSAVLKRRGVKGLVVWPVEIQAPEGGDPFSAAVFKVDFHTKRGLVDNVPTRYMFEKIVDLFGLAFQEGLAATTAEMETEAIDEGTDEEGTDSATE